MVVKTETLEEKARELLKERGVTVEDIAQLVMFLQKDYISDLTLADCTESVNSVLTKREVHNAIITGIQLDILAEKKKLMSPLQHIIEDDEGPILIYKASHLGEVLICFGHKDQIVCVDVHRENLLCFRYFYYI